jgi:hypothetical protein
MIPELEELERSSKEEGESTKEETPRPQHRRNAIYLENEGDTIDALFRLSKTQYETLKEKAKEKGVSMASFVREALIKNFGSDIPEETKQEIQQLLEDCSITDEEGEGFTIEDKQGFLNQVGERKLIGEIWTPEQLDKVAEKFAIGWERYFFRPDTDNLMERFSQAMKLDKTQRDYLEQRVTEIIEERSLPNRDEDDF